jgi:hypothetical protein
MKLAGRHVRPTLLALRPDITQVNDRTFRNFGQREDNAVDTEAVHSARVALPGDLPLTLSDRADFRSAAPIAPSPDAARGGTIPIGRHRIGYGGKELRKAVLAFTLSEIRAAGNRDGDVVEFERPRPGTGRTGELHPGRRPAQFPAEPLDRLTAELAFRRRDRRAAEFPVVRPHEPPQRTPRCRGGPRDDSACRLTNETCVCHVAPPLPFARGPATRSAWREACGLARLCGLAGVKAGHGPDELRARAGPGPLPRHGVSASHRRTASVRGALDANAMQTRNRCSTPPGGSRTTSALRKVRRPHTGSAQ